MTNIIITTAFPRTHLKILKSSQIDPLAVYSTIFILLSNKAIESTSPLSLHNSRQRRSRALFCLADTVCFDSNFTYSHRLPGMIFRQAVFTAVIAVFQGIVQHVIGNDISLIHFVDVLTAQAMHLERFRVFIGHEGR
jgi:hypothetical protein